MTDGKPTSTVYPIQLALSLEGSDLYVSVYGAGDPLQGMTSLPDNPDRYWIDLNWVALGNPPRSAFFEEMAQSVTRAAIPCNVRERLRELMQAGLLVGILAVEIQIGDVALEKYPWELLGTPGVITPEITNVVVWRRVAKNEQAIKYQEPSNIVMSVGSAPIDLPAPHTYPEIETIRASINQSHVSHYGSPYISIREFRDELDRVRPAVLHIVSHSDGHFLKIEPESKAVELDSGCHTHFSLHHQELAGQLRYCRSVRLLILSACHSSDISGRRGPPICSKIAQIGIPCIGMNSFLPAAQGITFSKAFYCSISLGATLVEAYYEGIVSLRMNPTLEPTLWSVPMLYSTDARPQVIIFPLSERARARRELRQIQELTADLRGLEYGGCGTPGDWAKTTTALSVRLAFLRGTITAVRETALMRAQSLSWRHDLADMEKLLDAIAAWFEASSHPISGGHGTVHLRDLQRHRIRLSAILRKLEYNVERS